MSGSPLCLYTALVQAEWLDVNNHMNVVYYALVFDKAAEAFMAYLGIDDDYIACRDASWVALESHTTFAGKEWSRYAKYYRASSRSDRRSISPLCDDWRGAEDGRKDEQTGIFLSTEIALNDGAAAASAS